jgi:DNA polymerase-3 subunit epsilon
MPTETALPPFVALDFETADYGPDSACAVALVRVNAGRIVSREARLVRPPRREFRFTYVHGLRWEDVADQPPFGDVWPSLKPLLDGAAFLAAHNARFDRGVLRACCTAAGLSVPSQPFECTMLLARHAWRLRPTTLPDVCRFLGLPLNHHDPASDAEACARIVLAVRGAGFRRGGGGSCGPPGKTGPRPCRGAVS